MDAAGPIALADSAPVDLKALQAGANSWALRLATAPPRSSRSAIKRIRSVLVMSEIDERLMDLVKRRSNLPASIAVMETHTHAQRINACLADLESNTMRLAACWDGELDPIGAFSQLSYLHEKVGRAESAARSLRKEIEKISDWDQPAPRE